MIGSLGAALAASATALLLGLAGFGAMEGASRPEVNRLPAELPEVLGVDRAAVVGEDDTLLDIAVRNDVGFDALRRLNPSIDVWMPTVGEPISLPLRMIPPNAPHEGLVINVAEMRLYDYLDPALPKVIPIAIGDPATPTPIGDRRVLWKTQNPVWKVPQSIRQANPLLPAEVAPGEDNPLGTHWMAIGNGYGIHGTNNLWSIGRIATHGCIRLQNSAVEALYERIRVGTRVHLVYQTVKLGRVGEAVYLEAHPDVYSLASDPVPMLLAHLLALGVLDRVDRATVERVVSQARGIPVRITDLEPGDPISISPRPELVPEHP